MLKFLKNPVFPLCGMCFFITACGPVDDRKEITEERTLPFGHETPPLGKSLRDRMMPEAKMSPPMAEPQGGGGADLTDLFEWETPEGWNEAAPTAMRLVNLRFGEGDAGECYLTILSGGGGGLEANVGRWYGQMGMEAPTAEELAALPRAPLLSRAAVVIDLKGTFTGMGSGAKPGYQMVGRILPQARSGGSAFTMFLKMTGPAEAVEENLEKFEQFIQSLAPKRPAAPE
jgi:hypothetical protein